MCEGTKILKFWPKNAWCMYFCDEIWKNFSHNWNQHPRICLIANFREKTEMSKFPTKNALFGYFWARILKQIFHIQNQHLRICLIAKFCEEAKMLKFATKNALFLYFWPKIMSLGILGLEFKKILLPYLILAPLNLSNCEVLWNQENTSIWDQKCLIWVFLGQNLKKLLSYLKSASPN